MVPLSGVGRSGVGPSGAGSGRATRGVATSTGAARTGAVCTGAPKRAVALNSAGLSGAGVIFVPCGGAGPIIEHFEKNAYTRMRVYCSVQVSLLLLSSKTRIAYFFACLTSNAQVNSGTMVALQEGSCTTPEERNRHDCP